MTKQCTVLVTAAFGPAAESVIYGLTDQTDLDIRLIALDSDKVSVAYARKRGHLALLAPSTADKGYLDFVLQTIKEHDVSLVIPILDSELETISRAKKEITSLNCALLMPAAEHVASALNKASAIARCTSLGITCPRTYTDIPSALAALNFPMHIKPARGVGGKNAFVVHDEEELRFYASRVHTPLIQEYVSGPEYTIDVLADASGNIIGAVPRERIFAKTGISVRGRTVNDKTLMDFAVAIAKAFRAIGPCNVQCFRTPDGNLVFSEINMRPAGSSTLSIEAGFNYPLLMAKMACGENVPPMLGSFTDGLYMLRHWESTFFGKEDTDG